MFLLQNFISLLLDISTQDFAIKILNKRELQQIAFNHSSDIGFKGFMHIYESIQQSDVFLVIDIILASDNSSRFRKNHLGRT